MSLAFIISTHFLSTQSFSLSFSLSLSRLHSISFTLATGALRTSCYLVCIIHFVFSNPKKGPAIELNVWKYFCRRVNKVQLIEGPVSVSMHAHVCVCVCVAVMQSKRRFNASKWYEDAINREEWKQFIKKNCAHSVCWIWQRMWLWLLIPLSLLLPAVLLLLLL